jgi:hypothetical protein
MNIFFHSAGALSAIAHALLRRYCGFTAAFPLLVIACFTAALLLLYCCFTAALLRLYCSFTAALLMESSTRQARSALWNTVLIN